MPKILQRARSGRFLPPRGQGLIETALLLPVLLIVLSGMVELGFLLNEYMGLQDAARNAARYASDNDYLTSEAANKNCEDGFPDASLKATTDFYGQIACVVNSELKQEKPELTMNYETGEDDVVVSVFSVISGTVTSPVSPTVTARFPTANGEDGWSGAFFFFDHRNQVSRFSRADINARLRDGAPNTGYVLVEIFFNYDQKLKLPWIRAFIKDPSLLHAFAIMPLVSAEPTSTPLP